MISCENISSTERLRGKAIGIVRRLVNWERRLGHKTPHSIERVARALYLTPRRTAAMYHREEHVFAVTPAQLLDMRRRDLVAIRRYHERLCAEADEVADLEASVRAIVEDLDRMPAPISEGFYAL